MEPRRIFELPWGELVFPCGPSPLPSWEELKGFGLGGSHLDPVGPLPAKTLRGESQGDQSPGCFLRKLHNL